MVRENFPPHMGVRWREKSLARWKPRDTKAAQISGSLPQRMRLGTQPLQLHINQVVTDRSSVCRLVTTRRRKRRPRQSTTASKRTAKIQSEVEVGWIGPYRMSA